MTVCFRCGLECSARVDGPTADDVAQICRWECQVLDVHDTSGQCRAAVICWPCFWQFDPDCWIELRHWDGVSPAPVVPGCLLPPLASQDPTKYQMPSEAVIASKQGARASARWLAETILALEGKDRLSHAAAIIEVWAATPSHRSNDLEIRLLLELGTDATHDDVVRAIAKSRGVKLT